MVLGVCRRVLGDRHEAEDAFQATFLVLARKAGAIARREQLANWLHGVASRTALDARARADRRRARERKAFAMSPATAGPDDGPERGELRAILDEELARLPASYRGAVVLCELDGLLAPGGRAAARHPRGHPLQPARPGQGPAAPPPDPPGPGPVDRRPRGRRCPARPAPSILPPSLAGSTIEAATRVAAGASLAEAASASVVTLTQGALHTMLLAKVKGHRPRRWPRRPSSPRASACWPSHPVLPVPGPSDDRLGAVEKKLDRILEALGSRQRRCRACHCGAAVASAMAAGGPDSRRPWQRRARRPLARCSSLPPTSQPRDRPDARRMMGAWRHGADDGARHERPWRRRWASTRPIEARIADLERRFADLERRFDAMESRSSTAVERSASPAPDSLRPIGRSRGPTGRSAARGADLVTRARISPRPKGPVSPPSSDQPTARPAAPFRSRTTTSCAAASPDMTGNRPAGLPTSVPGPASDHRSLVDAAPRPC